MGGEKLHIRSACECISHMISCYGKLCVIKYSRRWMLPWQSSAYNIGNVTHISWNIRARMPPEKKSKRESERKDEKKRERVCVFAHDWLCSWMSCVPLCNMMELLVTYWRKQENGDRQKAQSTKIGNMRKIDCTLKTHTHTFAHTRPECHQLHVIEKVNDLSKEHNMVH